MKTSQKTLISWIVVIVVVIAVGAYLYVNNKQNAQTLPLPEQATTTASTPATSTAVTTPFIPGSVATSTSPSAPNIDTVLKKLSAEWWLSPDLGIGGNKATLSERLVYAFPNTYDSGAKDFPKVIPPTFDHLLSIPFHDSSRILRVYFGCTAIQNGSPANAPLCGQDELRLVVYDPQSGVSSFLGRIKTVSYTGNSGALYVPLAITPDDNEIILDAWMGSPGAGGSLVDYGYAVMPSNPVMDSQQLISEFSPIATRSAVFYNSYGKVIFISEGDNTPHYSQPGPSNNASVEFRNLLSTSSAQAILDATDTSYKIVGIDVPINKLTLQATKYTFSPSCPRAENALMCAQAVTSTEEIPLP